MTIQNVSSTFYAPDRSGSKTEDDPQVKRIEAQIKDWECCPTTDAKTKNGIVDKLETQLDSLKAGLERHQLDIRI